MHHSVNNAHAAAVYCSLTGHDRGDATVAIGAAQHDYPHLGAVFGQARPPETPIVPFVHLPYVTKEGAGGPPQPGFFGGFLGRSLDPLIVTRDPNAPDFSVPELTLVGDVNERRLATRDELLNSLDRHLQSATGVASPLRWDSSSAGTAHVPATQQAFRIRDKTRRSATATDETSTGRACCSPGGGEAGMAVTVSWAPDANATWDTHGGNFEKCRKTLLPQLDAACGALLDDLVDRRMLERTIVAVFGDFGRSPKINPSAGRDHWNWCYSLQVFGGGFKPGMIYGASDATGAYPARDPLLPGDVISTLYHALGVPHDGLIYDSTDRPHRIVPVGDVVPELLA
jgi:hypothetical protein